MSFGQPLALVLALGEDMQARRTHIADQNARLKSRAQREQQFDSELSQSLPNFRHMAQLHNAAGAEVNEKNGILAKLRNRRSQRCRDHASTD
jgi:hypothetical protein